MPSIPVNVPCRDSALAETPLQRTFLVFISFRLLCRTSVKPAKDQLLGDVQGVRYQTPGTAARNASESCGPYTSLIAIRANQLPPPTILPELADDLFPDDPQTCEDYGFTRAFTAANRSKLLGLYIGLVNILEVSPKTLHGWLLKGTLVEEIKKAFETLPANNRGGYYAWFLENQWVLDHSKSPPTNPVYDQMMRAWRYTGGSPASSLDEMTSTRNNWPEEKRTCFNLCLVLLSDWHPSPDELLWRQFGFCVCRDEWSERPVARLYKDLIARCNFDEFCAAYQSSTLISLFRAKRLGTDLRNIPHLEDVLDGPMSKSVWDLKQYVMTPYISCYRGLWLL